MIIFQKGFNYSQDGPGNRLVYHLQGCNFSCKWCSNPEGMDNNQSNRIIMSVDEVVKEVISCKPMFFEGGGVTFTGGECTLYHDELLEVFKQLRAQDISTCIETNGSDPKLDELLPYISYLIVDLKHVDEDKHQEWIGVKNTQTKINIAKILESGRQILIRIPLIKNVNVEPELYCEFFKQHNMGNAEIEILPYHEYGKDKWTKEYQMKDAFVSQEDVDSMENAFKNQGYKVIHT